MDEGVSASIVVQRTGGVDLTASVHYQTANGSAIAGSDYDSVSGDLTFNPGDSSKTITIPTNPDDITEGNEYFSITLSSPNGAALASPSTSNVTIRSTPAYFSFIASNSNEIQAGCLTVSGCSFSEYLALENVGSKTITVQRSGNSAIAVGVNYATSNTTAIAGSDYTSTSGRLEFAAGETIKTFVVPIANDTEAEGNQAFKVTLSNPSSGSLISNIQRNVVIRDSFAGFLVSSPESPGYRTSLVGVSFGDFSVFENAGFATITVRRIGVLESPTTIRYQTGGGSAIAGEDYTSVNGDLIFASNETEKTFTIPILPDSLSEGRETVGLTLTYISGETTVVGTSGTLTINESLVEFPCEYIAPSNCRDWRSVSIPESTTFIDIPIAISGAFPADVIVSYSTANGTAIAGQDYTATSGQVTFSPTGSTQQTVRIPILDDSISESDETFTLNITGIVSGQSAINTSRDVSTITLKDSTIRFGQGSFTGFESGSILVNVVREGDAANAVSVDYATSGISGVTNGSATPNVDFIAVSGTLSFAVGETSKTFTIPNINDDIFEGTETLNVVLRNPVGETFLANGLGSEVPATIIEDNIASLSFEKVSYSVNENGGSVTLKILRSGFASSSVVVSGNTSSVSATDGTDFIGINEQISFAPNETFKTITIPILDDSVQEGIEIFDLSMSVVSGEASISRGISRVGIVDPVVQFRGASFTANEASPTATIFVVLNGNPNTEVTVNYATLNGTATSGLDYTATNGSLTFAIGETEKSFDVPLLNDSITEGVEFLNISLTTPTGEATLGSPASARLNITEVKPTVQIPGYQLNVVKSGGIFSGKHLAGIAIDSIGNIFVAADEDTNSLSSNRSQIKFKDRIAQPLLGTEKEYFDLYKINVAGNVSLVGRYDVFHFDLVNLEFGPDGGLYTAGSDKVVYRINTTDASISVFNTDIGLNYFRYGMEFDAAGNLIFMTENAPNSFYRIPAGSGSVFLGSYSLDNYSNYGTRFGIQPDGDYVIYPDGPSTNNPRITQIMTGNHTPGTPFNFNYLSNTNVRTLGAAFGFSIGSINPANGDVFSSGGNFGDGSSVILYTQNNSGSFAKMMAGTSVTAVNKIGNNFIDGAENLDAKGVTDMDFGVRRDGQTGQTLYFIDDFDDTIYQLISLSPTAANANFAGRVVDNNGRAIRSAIVSVTDQNGIVLTGRTNPFGYFRVLDIPAGANYVTNASAKGYTFDSQVLFIGDSITDFQINANADGKN